MHGGSAPQVKKAARERIAEMVDPALGVLYRAMKMGTKKDPAQLAVVAARDILDRAGYKATDRVLVTGSGIDGQIEIEGQFTLADKLKAELDGIAERITTGTDSKAPGSSTG